RRLLFSSPPPCGEGSGVGVHIGSFASGHPPPRPSPQGGREQAGARGAAHRAIESSHPLDDGGSAHAAADAQRHQRGRLAGALQLVEHGA
ncbi:hypothetical protein DU475_23080, partial [Rhodopseudomonas sp. WA056]|nr:hypothetical protein [Rhodopseudomonas sp. WA056]